MNKEDIINYYRTNKNNCAPTIAKHFNVPVHTINKIINDYLKNSLSL